MYARTIDEAAAELRELRATEREDLGLALVALIASLVATRGGALLALPLFLGASESRYSVFEQRSANSSSSSSSGAT